MSDTYTAWSLLVDLGAVSALLLIGKLARALLRPFQVLLLPSSIPAGLLGLALGPKGLGLIPFSNQFDNYATILIAVVFAAIPFSGSFNVEQLARGAKAMWSYSVAMYALQWGLGLAFSLTVLSWFFDLPAGFGVMLAAGWAGGFGTAAAVGSAFAQAGWGDATSLGFTFATMGVIVCIVGGLILIKWAARNGHTHAITSFDRLPREIRTGLVAPADRKPIGNGSVSPGSLEPLAMHLCLVTMTVLGGYNVLQGLFKIWPGLALPLYAPAFLLSLLMWAALRRTPLWGYIDGKTMRSVSGTATDLLVTVGIVAVSPRVVAAYAMPLTLLLIFGTVYCVLMLRFLTPRVFSEYWFEKGIFTWGWSTASVATGMALLRIVDPKLESETLEEYGLSYIGFVPLEIAIVISAPLMIAGGLSWAFAAGSIFIGVASLALGSLMGWFGAASMAGRA